MSRVGQVTGKIQEGSLYGLLFLLPFSKAAIEIGFVVLLIAWSVARLHPATRADTVWTSAHLRPLIVSLAGYLAVCALSITVSDYPLQSIRALFSKWLEYLLFFVIVTDVARRPGVARRCVAAMACSAPFVVIEGVAQELYGKGVIRGHSSMAYYRMTGPYENPGDLSTYLMVAIPVLFSYYLLSARRRRIVLAVLLLALTLCLGRTETFGAWFGFGIGVGAVFLWNHRMRRYGLILLASVALAGSFFLQRYNRLGELFSPTEVGKVDRIMMWQAAWGMIRDRPILGHGLNTFMANYLDYWVGGERMPRYAHNCYLQVWAETGIVGLLLFVALLGLLFARFVAGLRRIRFDGEPVLLLGLVAGLLAFVVQAGMDTNFYSLRQAAMFWILSGVALGLIERADD